MFFRDAHSPWHRGSTEYTNGLLRDYCPKGTDLSVFDAKELRCVAVEINDPPKTLGRSRPADLFSTLAAA